MLKGLYAQQLRKFIGYKETMFALSDYLPTS